jgi:hypothetical protein
MDLNQFNIIIEKSIDAYRWIGGILLAIGGSASIFTILKDDFMAETNSTTIDNNAEELK